MKYLKQFEKNKYSRIYTMLDLLTAVSEEDIYLIKDIINSGFDINTKDSHDRNILNIIAREYTSHYNYDIIKIVIDAGVDVDNVDSSGDTPLTFVAYEPTDIKFVKMLIEADADWYIDDYDEHDFFEYLDYRYKNEIAREYPEKHQEYLMKKDAEKYNL